MQSKTKKQKLDHDGSTNEEPKGLNHRSLDKRHCEQIGCTTRPVFNTKGETKGRFCVDHKTRDMVDVKNKKCEQIGCTTRPAFNVKGETKARFCADHKEPKMVDVISKKCEQIECTKFPTFNTKGESKARFCADHKQDGMADVKSKKCEHIGCTTRPNFNVEGESTCRFCADHKQDDMVDVISKQCEQDGCIKQPTFNTEGETKARFCITHKQYGMINVMAKYCIGPGYPCDTQAYSKAYDGYCLRCFIHLFPDKPVARNYKNKELAVKDFIESKFPDFTWISDKRIQGGCSKRRPDLFLDIGFQVLMIEVDEHQHTDYNCSCENKRKMELSKDIGGRPYPI
jgi:hypothetical protein